MATVKIEVTLTDEEIINLLDCAGYGIGYWATRMSVDETRKTFEVVSENRRYLAKFEDITTATNVLLEKGRLPDWFMREIRQDDVCGDSDVGDMLVQQAIFGDLIYG